MDPACRLSADAIVIDVRDDGLVDLEFAPRAACAACAGTCLWKRLQASRIERLRLGQAFAPGTAVTVSLPDRRVLRASLAVHGLPLAAILAGAAAGAVIGKSDLATLAGVLLALALVLAAFRPLRRWIERDTLADLVVRPRL